MNKFVFSLVCASMLSFTSALAEAPTIDVNQVDAIKTALQSLVGKSAAISIGQGETVSGIVEAVGPDAVKVKELTGKEFYSAVVKLNAINAVVYRAK